MTGLRSGFERKSQGREGIGKGQLGRTAQNVLWGRRFKEEKKEDSTAKNVWEVWSLAPKVLS